MSKLIQTVMELVSPEGNCKCDLLILELTEVLQKKIQSQPNWAEKKFDNQFIVWIASLIENVFTHSKKLKIDKKEIFFKIIERIFGNISEADKRIISNNLESVLLNGLVKKISKNVLKRGLKKLVGKK